MADKKDLSKILDVDYGELKKEAEELGKEISEALSGGYKNSLYQSDISVRRAFDTRYEAIKYQLEFGVISEEEYYEKLASIRDAYFSKNSQEWYKYTAEIYEYRLGALKDYENAVNAHFEDIKDGFSKTAQDAGKILGQIEKAREKYESKLYNFAGEKSGFETRTIKVHNYYPTGDSLVWDEHTLSNLEEDVERLRDFNESLEMLKKRGNELSPEVFDEFFRGMRDLSIEDAGILSKLLLKANGETFVKYLNDFKEKNMLSEQIADSLYKDDFSQAALDIKSELERNFSEIPEEFFDIGSTTAVNFKEGFLTEIKSLFSDITETLEEQGMILSNDSTGSEINKSFSATYNFYGNGETVSQQLISAGNHAVLQKLRGGI